MNNIGNDLYKYILKIANKKMIINEKDIIIDGLLKCYKCGEFKQEKIKIKDENLNENFIVPKMCLCEKKEYNDKKSNELKIKKIEKINLLKKEAFKNKNYYNYTLLNSDNTNLYINGIIKQYIENWNECKKNGIGLFLYGNIGVGKTFYACCIANELLNNENTVMFTSISEIVNDIFVNYGINKTKILNKLKEKDLIIIDDFQIKNNSEYEVDIIYDIINTLYENSKPLIITTNLDINDFKSDKLQYKKIYDRMAQMCTAILVESNINKRRIKSLKRKEIIKKILKNEK